MSRPYLYILFLLLFAGCATVEEQALPEHAPTTVPSPNVADVSLLPGYRAEVVVSLLNYPSSIAFDAVGNLYVAECGAAPGDESRPPRILRIAPGGQIDIMSDAVATPVKQVEWRNGQLVVWHGEKISSIDHEGQLRDLKQSIPPAASGEEKITDLTAAFGRPGQVFRIIAPKKDHGGQVLRFDPKTRRSSVFFCARTRPNESSIGAGAGPRRPVDLAFSADGQALYIADFGASVMTKGGIHSFPETGVIWRIVKDGTSISGPPANLAPPPQVERRPVTSVPFLP